MTSATKDGTSRTTRPMASSSSTAGMITTTVRTPPPADHRSYAAPGARHNPSVNIGAHDAYHHRDHPSHAALRRRAGAGPGGHATGAGAIQLPDQGRRA